MSDEKEGMKCELNENENDVLDLPSLEIVTFGFYSFMYCHVSVFESMWWLFISISFLILDLPKLHIISFIGYHALAGDDRANRKTIINDHRSYNNTLIMKSKWKEMKCEFCCYDNCLDLPSLTKIQGNQEGIYHCMGYVILESMICFYLIWYNRHSKSHRKQHWIR